MNKVRARQMGRPGRRRRPSTTPAGRRDRVEWSDSRSEGVAAAHCIPHRLRTLSGRSSRRCNTEPSRNTMDDAANRVDEAVPEGEKRFRIIYERAGVGIEQVAPDGRLVEVN